MKWKQLQNGNVFCRNGKLIPSIFLIGVQKCGTTTLDAILEQFKEISHGIKKEHHFFDHDISSFKEYIHQFPNCDNNRKNSKEKRKQRTNVLIRSLDSTPNYTNPSSKSAERIKVFYDNMRIPIQKLVFVAIVCPNSQRLLSGYYHGLRLIRGENDIDEKWIKSRNFTLNNWIAKKLDNWKEKDPYATIKRGFYDKVFEKYLKLFPKSKFLIIDKSYAFEQMQKLSDFLATELRFPSKIIKKNIHRNKGIKKTEYFSEDNLARLKQLFGPHERKFLNMLINRENVKLFPTNEMEKWNEVRFLKDWNISKH